MSSKKTFNLRYERPSVCVLMPLTNFPMLQVFAHCVAVGDKQGVAQFVNARESTSFAEATEGDAIGGQSIVEVPVVRVDDFVPQNSPIFLFKTDTQGFELGVLKGAHAILSTGRVFLLMIEFSYGLLKRAGTEPIALLEYVYDIGYVCTYMAYHTRYQSDLKDPVYGVVEHQPDFGSGIQSVTFDHFVESLRLMEYPGTAGVSGWTDLLCWNAFE